MKKTITACLITLGVAISVGMADEIKVKGEGIRPIIATTTVTDIGGLGWEAGADKGEYLVTAQIVGTNVVIVEKLVVPSQGTNSESVITTNIPINSLPQTFTLSMTLPTGGSGCPTEHAKVTVLRVKPRIRDQELPEKSIKVGDDYAAARRKIIAAGGQQTYIPLAPVGTPPEPVVDNKGNTNWVSHYDPLPQLFRMKDGRLITIGLTPDGSKVSGIGVEPPLETND